LKKMQIVIIRYILAAESVDHRKRLETQLPRPIYRNYFFQSTL